MTDTHPHVDITVPPGTFQPYFDALGVPRLLCGMRRCRRHGRCLVVDPSNGWTACTPRVASPVWAPQMDALLAADEWLVGHLMTGIPQPFGEWPEATIGPRLAACRILAGETGAPSELAPFRRWWKGCRAAAIAAGWSIPRRSSAGCRRHPPKAPNPPRRAADPAALQPPEMAQPTAGGAENGSQTLDL